VARELLAKFALAGLRITVHKPGAVAEAQDVGVTLERRREDYSS
jgi:dihydroneopterin aldolase